MWQLSYEISEVIWGLVSRFITVTDVTEEFYASLSKFMSVNGVGIEIISVDDGKFEIELPHHNDHRLIELNLS